MRVLMLILIMVFLLGCAPHASGKFNVFLLNATHEDVFDDETNRTLDTISFIMQNNEPFALDCSVMLTLDNTTLSGSRRGDVGVLEPGQKKMVGLSFEMPQGKTDLSIEPECQRP